MRIVFCHFRGAAPCWPNLFGEMTEFFGTALKNDMSSLDSTQDSTPPDLLPYLLPKDPKTEWLRLIARESFRNSHDNVNLRHDPVIPRAAVGPWVRSTIKPEHYRVKFEVS